MKFRALDGGRIHADIKMSPAQGMHAISTPIKLFFMANWEQACKDLERDGHVVVRGTPEIPVAGPVTMESRWGAIPLVGKIAIIILIVAVVAVLAEYLLVAAIIILAFVAILYAVIKWL